MAAGVRSDRRIARIRDITRTAMPRSRRGCDCRTLPGQGRKSGCVDLYLESAQADHITVALTGRGREQLHRFRGMSTGIRAPVHERVDVSAVTF
jgi:hypothetical protein